jgi:putative transposase
VGRRRGRESAKLWLAVLTELRNRGVHDMFFTVCNGLNALPDSMNATWPLATVQACIIDLIRGSFRHSSRKYWDKLSRDLKPIYQAVSAEAAAAALDDPDDKWGKQYPAILTRESPRISTHPRHGTDHTITSRGR